MSNGTHKNTLELCSATTRNHHHSTTGSTEQATRGRATAEAERFMVQTRERGFWKTYGTKIQYGGHACSWNSFAASFSSVTVRQSETIIPNWKIKILTIVSLQWCPPLSTGRCLFSSSWSFPPLSLRSHKSFGGYKGDYIIDSKGVNSQFVIFWAWEIAFAS